MEIRKQKKNYLAWRRIGTRWEDLGIVGTIRHDEKKKLFGLEVHHLVLNIFIFPNKKYIYIYIYICSEGSNYYLKIYSNNIFLYQYIKMIKKKL
jgi:hypothetical protein